MARKNVEIEARFLQTLVFSGEAQLILLSINDISYVLAVAVTERIYEEAYFGAKITVEQLYDYLNERFDLRYLIERPAFKDWYIFDLADMSDGVVPMVRRKLNKENKLKYLPGHGIFAREHTEVFNFAKKSSSTKEVFDIDGAWDLPEFSQFYNYYTDLYIVYNSIDIFLDGEANHDDKRRVQEAFNKPWQGGGSYGSFYHSLLAVQSKQDRLRVGGIQYNSPGHVEIRGKELPFSQVRELVVHFGKMQDDLAGEYKELYKFLRRENLLTKRASEFDAKSDLSKVVAIKAKKFGEKLSVAKFESLLEMSFGDPLIAAKVLLSIYRRLAKMLEFFAQGRVSFSRA